LVENILAFELSPPRNNSGATNPDKTQQIKQDCLTNSPRTNTREKSRCRKVKPRLTLDLPSLNFGSFNQQHVHTLT
jgi:hypothetical protein